MKPKTKWKLKADGKTLNVEFINKGSLGEFTWGCGVRIYPENGQVIALNSIDEIAALEAAIGQARNLMIANS